MTADLDAPIRQFRYQLTREDIAAYHFLPRELVGWEKLWLFGPILVCGAAAGYFESSLKEILPWDPDTQLGQLVTVLGAIAIGYLLSLILLTARTRHRINAAHVPESETRVDVLPQLLFAGAEDDQASYVWSKLGIIETATHIFLTQAGRADAAKAAWTALRDHLLALPNLERGSHAMSRLLEEAQQALKPLPQQTITIISKP